MIFRKSNSANTNIFSITHMEFVEIYIKIKRHSSTTTYATIGKNTLHPTYCHRRNPQSISATRGFHIQEKLTS